jgi:eukaryotic-like serine/threonine-protein kinase
MQRFISELRQRGVLRAAGLYIAVVWLALQIADVVFPAFDIPDESVKYILYVAIGLFPLLLLFSWFYEFTSAGLLREEEVRESGVERRHLQGPIALLTIAALAMALAISLFFNVQQVAEEASSPPENVSLLIADALNRTGEPIFDGVLEQALAIGLEGASFINSAPRHTALNIANQISEGEGLTLERSRLVALREGISLVLVGEIAPSDKGYQLSLQTINAGTGEVIAEANSRARERTEVLQAVAELTDTVREELGDVTVDDSDRETFSAGSLEAVSAYTRAQELARAGRDEEAVALYEQAVEADPDFGRAYSGWALSELNLGHTEKSEQLWQKALSMLEGMTPRERYRTLGLYYSLVSNNLDKAIENYKQLVEAFPADGVGHNNLAVVYFMDRQFDEAREEGAKALQIYPHNTVLRSNYALYAMYSGEFELAAKAAEKVIASDPDFHKPYLAKAIAALARGDFDAAQAAYDAMAGLGQVGASLAAQGKADIALLQGAPQRALDILEAAIAVDRASGNENGVRRKQAMKAQAHLLAGDTDGAREVAAIIEQGASAPELVIAGLVWVQLGELERAEELRQRLSARLPLADRAAGDLIHGAINLARDNYASAVDAYKASLAKSDSWLGHFELGRTYATAGSYAEALTEFELCYERIGEASALALDDQPTFHFTADLHYWLGKVRAELGLQTTAVRSLQRFVELRQTGAEAGEARRLLDSLHGMQESNETP